MPVCCSVRRRVALPSEQSIKLRYIAAVEELRRRRAPHLYGGRTPTATPRDSPCDTPPSDVGTLLTARGATVETEGATLEEAEAATRLQARYRGQRDRAQNAGAGAAAANEEEDGELAVVDLVRPLRRSNSACNRATPRPTERGHARRCGI